MNMTTDFEVLMDHARAHSAYFSHLLDAHPEIIPRLRRYSTHALGYAEILTLLGDEAGAQVPEADEASLKKKLRLLRREVMAILILRDLSGQATLNEVMETMTLLAEVSTNIALECVHCSLRHLVGEPLDSQGAPQRLMVVGMGKLGGRELNVSSDVDYIFIYPEEGETSGGERGKKIEVHEFFTRLGKRLIALLDDRTEDGFVFRVDMRLRPHGDSGALVTSLAGLEHYLITQGREWERYAWIKARVINSGSNVQAHWIEALQTIVRPFIYRKYLDFGAINAMRDLHAQIRREVARRDHVDDIKLGAGGIREIEFIAQVFQLIRGGRDTALQIRPTLAVLPLLRDRHLLSPEANRMLHEAYVFLRRLEHRLQYVHDAQTHRLPKEAALQALIAQSMGYEDWGAFSMALEAIRHGVSAHFEAVFSEPEEGAHPLEGLWFETLEPVDAIEKLATLGFNDPPALLARLRSFREGVKYQQLPSVNRERLDALGPRLIEVASQGGNKDRTWQRGLDFLETVSRRGAYLALLQQYPQALKKLAEIMGSSAWAARYLTQHPILLDEILDPRLYEIATDWASFRTILSTKLAEIAGDTEREMDLLRELYHAQVFRLLAQDIAGLQTVERLADHLTELADIVLQTILKRCWVRLQDRHPTRPDNPPFAVIAYGKLGGKELGYGSDLDLVFVHDDISPEVGALYTRLIQRVGSWAASQTSAGMLFDLDYRLRPHGDAGTLVNSFEAFRTYLLEKAWVFEHQALTRARFCAGDPHLGQRFEALRIEILRMPRDRINLAREVLSMRARMQETHASHDEERFDLKHDTGGLVDVEFIVQFIVLGYAHQHARLCDNLGNIALLRIAAELGLIPEALARPVQDAYREYRRIQHGLRLEGVAQQRVLRAPHVARIAAVKALWATVFACA